MPLKWRPCAAHIEGSLEGGHGSHHFCLVYKHSAGGERDGGWIWTMNGMPHNAKVPLLGYADTAEEAQQAADEIFDQWLMRARLTIATKPAGR